MAGEGDEIFKMMGVISVDAKKGMHDIPFLLNDYTFLFYDACSVHDAIDSLDGFCNPSLFFLLYPQRS